MDRPQGRKAMREKMSNLVIVESPAKAKTIKKYLGSGYEVTASMGHVRDLPKSKLGVDIENNFEPQYINIKGKGPLIKELKKSAKASDVVYLATDPDREGEAISWHLAHILDIPDGAPVRVTFNEITKSGVKEGMEHPRPIMMDRVDAQQARRILDRIVGYKISPFLWKKIRPGLSAGRVQSVAVRLIVDREAEINAFVPVEYWSIDALLMPVGSDRVFAAKFWGDQNGKIELKTEEQSNEILKKVENGEFFVKSIKKGTRKKAPAAPFITSTLQQEASRRLSFQARRTMKAAQELYEGVDIKGMGPTGLITYMRTDSLRISDEARAAGVAYIRQKYGDKYVPEKPRIFKSKNTAQDAHEAIRPSIPSLTPEQVKGSLTDDQYKLYKLIWERFTASLMADCIQDTVKADIVSEGYIFKASGYSVRFDGFTVLYEEAKDDETENGGVLPPLSEGEKVRAKEIKANQHFTQPPPRYTEATLIKALEENGIGRPSTYAPTISTILTREYVERDGKNLKPTALGEITTNVMKDYFKSIVDVEFTAGMEEKLDEIENGTLNYKQMLNNFYDGFEKTLENASESMDGTRIKVPDVETDVVCENCGRKMVIKTGRYGKFLACPGYPECKNTKPIMKETGGECPVCGGRIFEKKSKNGHKYFGCENNPTCGFMTWDTPLKTRCPQCGKTLFKRRGGLTVCLGENCGYEKRDEKAPRKTASKKTAAKKAADDKKTDGE